MKTLVAWIGQHDLNAADTDSPHSPGPIGHAVDNREFDAAIHLPVCVRTQTGQNLEVRGYGE